jgi:hypothetical protein
MRLITYLITLGLIAFGAWWVWNNYPPVRKFIESHLETGDFQTLEVRYTPEQIIEAHKKELIKGPNYTVWDPSLKFYPYAFMEVKYTNSQATSEGIILWGLEDGEMVLDANSWEKTHGFEDCINAKADKNDFKVLFAIAQNGGAIDREKLHQVLRVENDQLDSVVESCRRKKLIVQRGNSFRLHFQQPRFASVPETKLNQWLVRQPYKNAVRVPGRYSLSQIEQVSQNAFGNDFTIRNMTEIYIPVYSIVIQNPDSSLLTTYWNAQTGKRLPNNYFSN